MFKPIDSKQSFPELEQEILKFWQKNDIFNKSLEKNLGKEKYVFYEGPPTANGKPGIHHVLARSFKDLIPRYKTMKGYYVNRRAGWDTHGLPVEIEVEKALGISGKKQIEDYGIEKFNQMCRESVWRYKDIWEQLTRRIGFWIDLENPYITYENEYIEKVWGILKNIWEAGLLYEGHKVVPYCPRCGTPLSSHEVAQGYKKIKEDSVYIKFKVRGEENTYILSWTTTPWTLPGNVALAVGKNITYVKVKAGKEVWILAKERLGDLDITNPEIVEELSGEKLIGLAYEPLFDVADLKSEKSYHVYEAPFVTTEDGAGVVHTAVMYGEDDYELGTNKDLPKVHTVTENGYFKEIVKGLENLPIKAPETQEKIYEFLKKNNNFVKVTTYEHDYPFCWRCDSPLIYFAKNSWFIAMSKLREDLINNNKEINWMPDYIKEGRFGEWLAEVKDWALSRERYWGTPLPVWQCVCGEKIFIGGIKELKEKAVGNIDHLDLHRPFVDEIKIKCPACGKEALRVKDLIDVWFDSGSMPFASGEEEKGNFPADFIAEALDQTRGWFYTLLAISTLLKKGTPYRNVICLGLVLDENGKKMSKSKGNMIEPFSVIDKFGADSVRWFFYTVNSPGDAKRMAERDVQETLRKFILILWNVYSFFTTYANIDEWTPEKQAESEDILDLWLKSCFNNLINEVEKKLDKYDVVGAARILEQFNTDLSTWYLRRSRKRRDKQFYSTIYQVLLSYVKIIAPFVPFISEQIFQNLRSSNDPESVHLCQWPKAGEIDTDLIKKMAKVREFAEQGRALRAEKGIRNRQPLRSFTIDAELSEEYLKILKDELNVLEVKIDKKISLDTELDEELINLGTRRDLVRLIQDLRKKANLSPKDSITINFEGSQKIEVIIKDNLEKLEKETNTKLSAGRKKVLNEIENTFEGEKIWFGL